jgi:peptide/nickel transport system ATP-binding protein
VLRSPRHPYTRSLLRAMPRLDAPTAGPLEAIRGQPPEAGVQSAGCAFEPRCERAAERCRRDTPPLTGSDATAACHFPLEDGR